MIKKRTIEVYKFRYRFITNNGEMHTYIYPYWIDPSEYLAGTVALMMSYVIEDGYIPDDENKWKVYFLTAIASIEIEPIASAFVYDKNIRRYSDEDLVEQ